MQHTEVPNELTKMKLSIDDKKPILKQGDKLIYALIRMHMDNTTRKAFPSIDTIRKYAHCRKKVVLEAIERLKDAGLIEISSTKLPNGKVSNLYEIKKTEFDASFERFTPEFLKDDLAFHLKEYLMDSQPYMLDKDKGVGNVSQSNLTIAKNTGWSISDINKFDKQLIALGIEEQNLSGKTDSTGLAIQKKTFDLEAIKQASLWVKSVNNQLNETQSQVEEIEDSVDSINEEFKKFKQETDADRRETKAQIKILQDEYNKTQAQLNKAMQLIIANGLDVSSIEENRFAMPK